MLVASSFGTRQAAAQDLQVIKSFGTRDEQTAMQTLIDRLKKAWSDPTLVQKFNAAFDKKDYATATAIVATAAGVKTDAVTLATPPSVGFAPSSGPIFRLASMPAYNPFWLIVGSGKKVYCIGIGTNGKQECHDALIAAGYKPLT
jgi:hypothetical protein